MTIEWYTLTDDYFSVRFITSLVSLSTDMCRLSVLVDERIVPLSYSPDSVMYLLDISTKEPQLHFLLELNCQRPFICKKLSHIN